MSRLRFVVLALAAIVGPTFTHAADPAKPGQQIWRATNGSFSGLVVFTNDPDGFLEEWEKPPEHAPSISSVEVVKRGDTVVAFVVFSGCKPVEGVCDATVDFELFRPDGSVYAKHLGAVLWEQQPPPGSNVQLSVANLRFLVEPDDPLGTYTLKVAMHDRHAKRDLSLERQITVEKSR